MKRWTAAILAALLLLSLAACQKTPEEPAAPAEPPALTGPDTPISSEDPIEPPDTPEQPAEAPVTPPDTEEDPPEALEWPVVTEYGAYSTLLSESGEPCVSYYPEGLSIRIDSEEAGDAINAYYRSAYSKFHDFCAGEVMALSEDGAYHYRAEMLASVERYDRPGAAGRRVISISRTAEVTGEETHLSTVTYYAETFDCLTGGILTADDFFAVPESEYIPRLTECVRRQISEDPYHDQKYFADWEELTDRTFEKTSFYVQEDNYVVYYQENDLGPNAAVFFIPWRELEDITA